MKLTVNMTTAAWAEYLSGLRSRLFCGATSQSEFQQDIPKYFIIAFGIKCIVYLFFYEIQNWSNFWKNEYMLHSRIQHFECKVNLKT